MDRLASSYAFCRCSAWIHLPEHVALPDQYGRLSSPMRRLPDHFHFGAEARLSRGSPQPVTEHSGDTGAWPFLPIVGFLQWATSAPELSLGLVEALSDPHLVLPQPNPPCSRPHLIDPTPPNTPLAFLTSSLCFLEEATSPPKGK